MLLKQCRWFNW